MSTTRGINTIEIKQNTLASELNHFLSPASFWPIRNVVTSAWLQHGPFALWLIDAVRPRTLVELGTHNGFSFLVFCQAVERLGLSTACYAVDTWVGDEHASFYGEEVFTRLSEIHSESYSAFSRLMRCRFDEALPYFTEASIDILHIDGRHIYEDVKEEFDSWKNKISSCGIVLFHDTNVRERQFGVWKLWDELRLIYPNFEFLHGHGLGVLAVGPDIPRPLRGLFSASPEQVDIIRSAYAHLGQGVSRQYDLQNVRQYVSDTAADRARSDAVQDEALRSANHGWSEANRRVRELEEILSRQQIDRDGIAGGRERDNYASGLIQQESERIRAVLELEKRRLNDVVSAKQERLRAAEDECVKTRDDHARHLALLRRTNIDVSLPRELRPLQRLFKGQFKKKRQFIKDYLDIAESPLFDSMWYCTQYPDVSAIGVDPIQHYLSYGSAEGRDPSSKFQTILYLDANPDVATAGENALLHFIRYGAAEGRRLRPASVVAEVYHPLGSFLPRPLDFRLVEVPAALPLEPGARFEDVDIIICVHNALDDVRLCLDSILVKTLPPYRLIIVDDGSQESTQQYLSRFAQQHGAMLIRNEIALGYTFAANAGMRAVGAEFCVLLNSDTEVTEGWLDRLVDYMRRDEAIGVVGPLSNTASWQSVPNLFEEGDWAANVLEAGWNADGLARVVATGAHRRGIPLGFINGFCMLMRRKMIDDVGLFDEQTFAAGYGEENDFCIRARQRGWRLVVADDAYVFHHQSRSYGNERRQKLARSADEALVAKHSPTEFIAPFVEVCRDSLMLLRTRLRIKYSLVREKLIESAGGAYQTRRIAFFLPVSDAGGGANVILQEIRALRRFGVDVWIINKSAYQGGFEKSYPANDIPTIYAQDGDLDNIGPFLEGRGLVFDAFVATAFTSFFWLPNELKGLTLCYYIQDLESLFFEKGSDRFRLALATYSLRPEVIRVTKSRWNRQSVADVGGHVPALLGASVDLDLFFPRSDEGLRLDRPVRILSMVRPETPRRGPERTLRVLRRLKDALGDQVDVACFGGETSQVTELGTSLDGIRLYGKLSPSEVAELLGQTDVFLDLSDWQAMGLTALEAMASGAAVLVPQRGGALEFCSDGPVAMTVDTQDEEECLAAALRLATDRQWRLELRRAGMEVACAFPPERAALALLEALWGKCDRSAFAA